LSGQHDGARQASGAPYSDQYDPSLDQKLLLHQNIADAKMSALMSQTLSQKESIIKALEAELTNETKRRKEISKSYKT